jgi:hypothetical protein
MGASWRGFERPSQLALPLPPRSSVRTGSGCWKQFRTCVPRARPHPFLVRRRLCSVSSRDRACEPRPVDRTCPRASGRRSELAHPRARRDVDVTCPCPSWKPTYDTVRSCGARPGWRGLTMQPTRLSPRATTRPSCVLNPLRKEMAGKAGDAPHLRAEGWATPFADGPYSLKQLSPYALSFRGSIGAFLRRSYAGQRSALRPCRMHLG